ncbi:lebercilin [Dunckerocampus dactyliophorus]|uniref:lebercilin n=1 Tax=Dunckerocampus dactyliophorus TaxID=161453 RepID=UPI002404B010|nr:lebercilin [Dunckerocampus dactyliophorus]XP_054617324.1 lebercilin [Dunckerocampus dactyliophorus]XP_054617325.1 lebercilin [Dunckerocampus dactyliophorus]
MESKCDPIADDWSDNQSRRSLSSVHKKGRASSTKKQKHNKNFRDRIQDEKDISKNEIYPLDPDRDQMSDGDGGRGSKGPSYSDDYENESLSERSLSPFSRDRTLSPTPPTGVRRNQIPSSSPYNTGVQQRVRARPPRPGGRYRGVRSRSKESLPPKDLDPLTKQMLSGRLLKINELRNAHAELQLRIVELQKENRILKHLQLRQEKALQNYTDAENKISQMLSCHANETHVLRERLRRTQERERVAERRLKEKEAQLMRSQVTVGRMKKLVEQRELGAREELTCKLEEERARTQEVELKMKELERNMELSSSSHQRQLAAERRKMLIAQEEIKTLQKELDQLTNKLREKERELETKNIYAHRMGKLPLRKVTEGEPKSKLPSSTHVKGVQAQDRTCSPDFPSPPPAVIDAIENNDPAPDGYLSLKQLDKVDGPPETGKRPNQEQQQQHQKKTEDIRCTSEQEAKEEQPAGWDKAEKEDEERKIASFLTNLREGSSSRKSGHVQEEVDRWNQEAAEARRRKDQLLAKMREIDLQNEGVRKSVFGDSFASNTAPAEPPSSHVEDPSLAAGDGNREAGRRRSLRSQKSNEDLIFGSYIPSFGNSRSVPPAPVKEDGDSALEAIGVFSLKGAELDKKQASDDVTNNKKSILMQQLFGSLATPSGNTNKSDILDLSSNGVRSGPRSGRMSFSTSAPPSASLDARHVVESRPTVRAIASFDDDIEELIL